MRLKISVLAMIAALNVDALEIYNYTVTGLKDEPDKKIFVADVLRSDRTGTVGFEIDKETYDTFFRLDELKKERDFLRVNTISLYEKLNQIEYLKELISDRAKIQESLSKKEESLKNLKSENSKQKPIACNLNNFENELSQFQKNQEIKNFKIKFAEFQIKKLQEDLENNKNDIEQNRNGINLNDLETEEDIIHQNIDKNFFDLEKIISDIDLQKQKVEELEENLKKSALEIEKIEKNREKNQKKEKKIEKIRKIENEINNNSEELIKVFDNLSDIKEVLKFKSELEEIKTELKNISQEDLIGKRRKRVLSKKLFETIKKLGTKENSLAQKIENAKTALDPKKCIYKKHERNISKLENMTDRLEKGIREIDAQIALESLFGLQHQKAEKLHEEKNRLDELTIELKWNRESKPEEKSQREKLSAEQIAQIQKEAEQNVEQDMEGLKREVEQEIIEERLYDIYKPKFDALFQQAEERIKETEAEYRRLDEATLQLEEKIKNLNEYTKQLEEQMNRDEEEDKKAAEELAKLETEISNTDKQKTIEEPKTHSNNLEKILNGAHIVRQGFENENVSFLHAKNTNLKLENEQLKEEFKMFLIKGLEKIRGLKINRLALERRIRGYQEAQNLINYSLMMEVPNSQELNQRFLDIDKNLQEARLRLIMLGHEERIYDEILKIDKQMDKRGETKDLKLAQIQQVMAFLYMQEIGLNYSMMICENGQKFYIYSLQRPTKLMKGILDKYKLQPIFDYMWIDIESKFMEGIVNYSVDIADDPDKALDTMFGLADSFRNPEPSFMRPPLNNANPVPAQSQNTTVKNFKKPKGKRPRRKQRPMENNSRK